ncbi:MAG TPA: hypothetical protein VKU00_10045, partial [Chthonomonadaceae bacterium]|nr:hypothetical protein [Chthonomonadaceae bacterium]
MNDHEKASARKAVSHKRQAKLPQSAHAAANDRRVAVLNRLQDEINAAYGFRDGAPRINLGPCGRFARDFRERWKARFREEIY